MPDELSEVELPRSVIKKKSKRWLWVGMIVILAGGFIMHIARGFMPGGDGILARVISSDQTEMCIVQTYNGYWAEPYTVSFYYRKSGKPWGWFYYEHEDTRWFSGKITFSDEGKTAHILCGDDEVALFDIPSESFTISRWKRTLSPAQEWMPDDWKPEDALTANQNVAKSPMEVGAPSNLPPSPQ